MKFNVLKWILPTEVPGNFSLAAERSRLYPKLDDGKARSPHKEKQRNFGYAF